MHFEITKKQAKQIVSEVEKFNKKFRNKENYLLFDRKEDYLVVSNFSKKSNNDFGIFLAFNCSDAHFLEKDDNSIQDNAHAQDFEVHQSTIILFDSFKEMVKASSDLFVFQDQEQWETTNKYKSKTGSSWEERKYASLEKEILIADQFFAIQDLTCYGIAVLSVKQSETVKEMAKMKFNSVGGVNDVLKSVHFEFNKDDVLLTVCNNISMFTKSIPYIYPLMGLDEIFSKEYNLFLNKGLALDIRHIDYVFNVLLEKGDSYVITASNTTQEYVFFQKNNVYAFVPVKNTTSRIYNYPNVRKFINNFHESRKDYDVFQLSAKRLMEVLETLKKSKASESATLQKIDDKLKIDNGIESHDLVFAGEIKDSIKLKFVIEDIIYAINVINRENIFFEFVKGDAYFKIRDEKGEIFGIIATVVSHIS